MTTFDTEDKVLFIKLIGECYHNPRKAKSQSDTDVNYNVLTNRTEQRD